VRNKSTLSLAHSSVPGLGKERLEALTDGIFATVMTVLVLSLSVPVIASGATNAEVATDLETLGPNILAYVLGFLLLAVLWISHHNVFHYMTQVDRPLLWLNTLFLLTIGFLPFSTALVGKYPQFQPPEVIFGANIIAISFCMLSILSYSSRTGLLVVPERDERVMGRVRSRWRTGPVFYLVAIMLSFINPLVSFAAYVAILIFMVVQSIFWLRISSNDQ
jgi:uncharacterized membrane protein